jgi:hypothetical protein
MHALFTPETLLAAIAMRGMPLLGYGLFAAKGTRTTRALLSAGYALAIAPLLATADGRRLLFCTAAALLYYALVGCGVHRLPALVRAGRITPGAVFALAALACMVVPALLGPGVALAALLAFGWDVMLSAHSYGVEVARGQERPRLCACLFFLLVNPALVFTARGGVLAEPARPAIAGGRLLLGLVAFCGGVTLLGALAHFPALVPWFPDPVSAAASFGVLRFGAEYAAHSGLASVQIATLRLFGYRAPEGYRYPFLARDPRDLWRRWNRYVGAWLQRYVFLPASRRAADACPRMLVLPVAVLATFAASAALHAAYGYFGSYSFDLPAVCFLLANGCAVALWPFAARACSALVGRTRLSAGRLAGALARACLLIALLTAVATWG